MVSGLAFAWQGDTERGAKRKKILGFEAQD